MAAEGRRSYAPHAIVGASSEGFSDATDHAIARAFQDCPALTHYQVERLGGLFRAGRVVRWEVTLTVGTAQDEACAPTS